MSAVTHPGRFPVSCLWDQGFWTAALARAKKRRSFLGSRKARRQTLSCSLAAKMTKHQQMRQKQAGRPAQWAGRLRQHYGKTRISPTCNYWTIFGSCFDKNTSKDLSCRHRIQWTWICCLWCNKMYRLPARILDNVAVPKWRCPGRDYCYPSWSSWGISSSSWREDRQTWCTKREMKKIFFHIFVSHFPHSFKLHGH